MNLQMSPAVSNCFLSYGYCSRRLNIKKYAVAYTQYLVEKYGIRDINELTLAHIKEQISVLQQCIDSKRKYNQLIKILGAVKVAA